MAASPNGIIGEPGDQLLSAWRHLSPLQRYWFILKSGYFMNRTAVAIAIIVLVALSGFLTFVMHINPGLAIFLVLLGGAIALVLVWEIERWRK